MKLSSNPAARAVEIVFAVAVFPIVLIGVIVTSAVNKGKDRRAKSYD